MRNGPTVVQEDDKPTTEAKASSAVARRTRSLARRWLRRRYRKQDFAVAGGSATRHPWPMIMLGQPAARSRQGYFSACSGVPP